MSNITCPSPSTTNALQSTGFLLRITKLPELSFWCKIATIPSVVANEVVQETPYMQVFRPGTRPDFTTFNISFTIDENMDNYTALYDWLTLITFAESGDDLQMWKQKYPQFEIGLDPSSPNLVSDGSLTVMGANGDSVRTITFRDMFPVSLDGFEINEENTDTTYLTANASFRYVGKMIISDRIIQQTGETLGQDSGQ